MEKNRIIYYGILIFLLLTAVTLLTGSEITVQRERAYLRQGPGSYFEVLSLVPVNTKLTVVQSEESWLKVKYNDQEGYLSETVTQKKEPRKDVFAQMGKAPVDVTVSRHGMSAGVKGFGERFSKAFKGNISFIHAAETYQLNPKEYARFVKETYAEINIKKIRKSYPLYSRKLPDYFTDAQDGFGLGIASAIASLGLWKNPVMQEYVNSVGQLVAEASDVTDVSFKFFILDIPQHNSYACPGGYIFITRGLLKALTNEAELACVLAHEVAHVSRFHGLLEIQQRKHQISAESAFSELDMELPEAYDEKTKMTEEELEDEAFGMFETIFQGRLDAYEQEADVWGMLFAARAGYTPQAFLSAIKRMVESQAACNNQHYRKDLLAQRIKWIKDELKSRNYPEDLLTHQARWQKFSKDL